MFFRPLRRPRFILGLLALPLVPCLLYGLLLLTCRPSRSDLDRPLFVGVTYHRRFLRQPRPVLIHMLELELTAPGLELFVTPFRPTGGRALAARTTSGFLDDHHLQVAVNGGYFEPFVPGNPISAYPKSGDPVDVRGQAISNGHSYSRPRDDMIMLCVAADGRVQFLPRECPVGARQGLAGFPLVHGGRSQVPGRDAPAPRTAAGLDATGARLLLMVVDGRQPRFSQGLRLEELAEAMIRAGAVEAINLDGGGSSTMVAAGWPWSWPLNSPIHTHIPYRERPVGNHLGARARPLAGATAGGKSWMQ